MSAFPRRWLVNFCTKRFRGNARRRRRGAPDGSGVVPCYAAGGGQMGHWDIETSPRAALLSARCGVGMLAASGLVGHSLMDGFAIGAAFQAGRTVAAVVAIAVISHDFADGFNTYTITSLYGNNRRRALTLLALDALAPVTGAAITLAVTIPQHVLGTYLGFFAGVLLYLATSDILPEAHTGHPSRLTLACTIGGAGFMWLVIGLAS